MGGEKKEEREEGTTSSSLSEKQQIEDLEKELKESHVTISQLAIKREKKDNQIKQMEGELEKKDAEKVELMREVDYLLDQIEVLKMSFVPG